MSLVDRIKSIVEEYLSDDLFVVDVLVKGKNHGQKLMVFVDGDDGISIDKCAEISRHLANQLDELDIIDNAYKLEVSSPGLDHPITMKRQFVKNTGRQLAVETSEEKFTGKLVEVAEDLIIEFKEKKEMKRVSIPFHQVLKANVLVSFK